MSEHEILIEQLVCCPTCSEPLRDVEIVIPVKTMCQYNLGVDMFFTVDEGLHEFSFLSAEFDYGGAEMTCPHCRFHVNQKDIVDLKDLENVLEHNASIFEKLEQLAYEGE